MIATGPRQAPRPTVETAEEDEEALSLQLLGSWAPPDEETNAYLAGEVIGDRYRLDRELGRGGMGVVWVAHSLVLDVDVALKLIRARSAGPAVASRMAREAHAAARLGHPALVRVFDFGWTSRGDPFLVMELVPGETLSALLQREGRIDAIRAVQMVLPVADGLRVAHDKHIIHRDIKPDNIFLATDAFGRKQPKLIDFGIAKVDQTSLDRKLTQMGVVLGSPEYMSPEQSRGLDDVDERTDVWSLSVVLYELVTGNIPFSKPNYNALMHSIIHDEPRSMQDEAAGDASLWRIVKRGLAKDRDTRWASMTELGEALALWLHEHGIKEDLSGNSIRAVWLDTTQLRSHVGMIALHADLPVSTASAVRSDADGSPPETTAATGSKKGSSREKALFALALALAIGACTGVLLLAAFGLGRGAPAQDANLASPTPAPTASASALQQGSASGMIAAPPSQASAGPDENTAPSANARGVDATRPRSAASGREPASKVPQGLPQHKANKPSQPKRIRDFGF